MSTAEELKEQGNAAFSSKDFATALEKYSQAIQLDPKNHVLFSNRSAAHAGNRDWKSAAEDAKECLRLNPTFLKGYYRLATAQNEMQEYSAAVQTLQQGLAQHSQGSDVVPLRKLLQTIQQKMKQQAAREKSAPGSAGAGIPSTSAVLDEAAQQELMDLQENQARTSQELQIVEQQILSSQKQSRIAEITESELAQLPEDRKCYKAIGKAFAMKWPSKDGVIEYLQEQIRAGTKTEAELGQKKEFLERRFQSQRQNIQELISSATPVNVSS